MALSGCFLAGPAVPGGRGHCPPTRGQQMVDLINDLRAREGLPPLRVDRRLVAAAQEHAEDMAAHGFVGHDGSDGSLPAFRVDRTRYPWILILENTAGGHATASATFAAWQASETHRRNHLDPDVRHVGIGYAENGATSLRSYWVAVFAASPEAPLTPPGGCHP